MQQGRIPKAIAGYQNLNYKLVSQLTYTAYEFMHQKPAKLKEAESILQLANEQYPQSVCCSGPLGRFVSITRVKKLRPLLLINKLLKANLQDKELQEKLRALTH